jgi:glutaredoxin 3
VFCTFLPQFLVVDPVLCLGKAKLDEKNHEREKDRAMAVAKVQQLIEENALIVFSKSYCPYCIRAKQLLKSLGATGKIIELDNEKDGAAMQTALAEISKQRTVPNIFIKGKHLGGCDDTVAAHRNGTLVPMLKDAGAIIVVEA